MSVEYIQSKYVFIASHKNGIFKFWISHLKKKEILSLLFKQLFGIGTSELDSLKPQRKLAAHKTLHEVMYKIETYRNRDQIRRVLTFSFYFNNFCVCLVVVLIRLRPSSPVLAVDPPDPDRFAFSCCCSSSFAMRFICSCAHASLSFSKRGRFLPQSSRLPRFEK